MKISVAILNYNVRYFLELCIKSVQEALLTLDSEIIVIDNNSSDDSCAMVKKLFPEVVLIQNDENVGFSKANNQAVQFAKGEYVCILNPDTVVAEDTFIKLLDFSRTKQDLGIVGCRLIDGTGKYLRESKRNIPVVRVAAQKMLGNVSNYYANFLKQNEIGKVDVLVGAFMLLKREVYNNLKGFDVDYFMYGEDIDLSYRLLKAGYSNYYYGETTIIHYKGESTLKNRAYAKRFYGAMQLFYKKHFSHNVIFDVAVWVGLQMAFLIRKSPKSRRINVDRYYFVSSEDRKELLGKLKKEIIITTNIEKSQPFSEIIFNANTMSYKTIIQQLSSMGGSKDLSFKILPKNSNFIIGSDDSINRGKVRVLTE